MLVTLGTQRLNIWIPKGAELSVCIIKVSIRRGLTDIKGGLLNFLFVISFKGGQ